MSAEAKFHDDELHIAFEGDGISPETVDSLSLLEMGAAFFELVREVAAKSDVPVRFTGLRIVEKCAAVAVRADAFEAAQEAAQQARYCVDGSHEIPGTEKFVKRVRKVMARQPSKLRVLHGAGSMRLQEIRPPKASQAITPVMASTLAVRAQVVRVGGANPAARFTSGDEKDDFTLEMDREMAARLAGWLYTEVDIEAIICRHASGGIKSGTLTSFHPLEDVDPLEAWGAWAEAHADGLREALNERKQEVD
ncbi:MAG: hypothetical protein KAI47_14490 [Deltaproteobacteria bacterium]|nr:hypothetical protein [Deltaproteobacteria bacterium]